MRCAWMRFLRLPSGSELVSHRDPVVPVLDRLARLVIRLDDLELRQGHGELPLAPGDRDEDLAPAIPLRRHADDLDLVADAERGDLAFFDAAGEERDVQG